MQLPFEVLQRDVELPSQLVPIALGEIGLVEPMFESGLASPSHSDLIDQTGLKRCLVLSSQLLTELAASLLQAEAEEGIVDHQQLQLCIRRRWPSPCVLLAAWKPVAEFSLGSN